VSGELKGGKASGDVRLSYLSEPGDDFNVGACGTGTLNWNGFQRILNEGIQRAQ
jgi:hypothetical protein